MHDPDHLESELQIMEVMICDFAQSIARKGRLIPSNKWNWSISERTPTAREVCEHTYAWLFCDRQQLTIADRSLHTAVPELPASQDAMLDLLALEAEEWRTLLQSLDATSLEELREAWDGEQRNIRGFLFHMAQNVVYKAGQISILVFELGLDGGQPYTAPYPDEIYGFENCKPWPSRRA